MIRDIDDLRIMILVKSNCGGWERRRKGFCFLLNAKTSVSAAKKEIKIQNKFNSTSGRVVGSLKHTEFWNFSVEYSDVIHSFSL